MSSSRALRTAALLCAAAIASFNAAATIAADANVCSLPASALYISRTTAPTPAPAARNATASPSARKSCWSQNAGITVDAACLSACSCRRLESETTSGRASRLIGVCLNSSIAFKCSGDGMSDCSEYALNADGSSTLKTPTLDSSAKSPEATVGAAADTETVQPGESSEVTSTPVVGAISKDSDDAKKGLAAWTWALIVAGIVLAAALNVFTVNWFKRHARSSKSATDLHERTDSMDDPWKHSELLEQGQAVRAVTTARPTQVPGPTSTPMPAAPSESSGAHRLSSAPVEAHLERNSEYSIHHTPLSRISDDGSSSVEMHSSMPIFSASASSGARRSVPRPVAGRADRAANNSQLSYATDDSYDSSMNSFSSQLTLTESEMRDSDFTLLDLSYLRKKSAEF